MDQNEGNPDPAQEAVDLTTFDIDMLLSLFVSVLSVKAWQYMGIRLVPGKEETEKDLVKASTAIDCVSFLVERLAPNLSESDAGRLKAMVSDLQINYAKWA